MANVMNVDIETYSSIDLLKSGVYHYVEAPDFSILLIGYSIDGGEVKVCDVTKAKEGDMTESYKLHEFKNALADPKCIKSAFNANFERTCLAKWLGAKMPPEEWRCTMVKCLTMGLPGSLAGAGIALGLPEDKLKDPKGKALIQYFSKPCKATRTNGGRTRNLPAHDPDKWALYIEYNRQDVVTEMAIADLLKEYDIPDSEQSLWSLDQRMNDRGVRIDVDMVEKIVDYDAKAKEVLLQEAQELTGLSNPNSLAQLKGWLAEQGVEMKSVTKDTIADVLAGQCPDNVRRVLEIRQALGKTSTAKYSTMLGATCDDGRLRGVLQFYGANRSGRWAGRLVQVHNLARNSIEDLDLARELAVSGDFETMETLYGETSFIFSELVRTAFIASEGRRFVVSDFSAIEARVISWIAGEEWRLEAFRSGKDIYCETASQMYKVPVVKHGVNGELRQKGKVAELACIAEGQLVLTDRGLVPIEEVDILDALWDGRSWVTHDGVIYKGEREVITYDGLTATADHLVWIEGQQEPVQFGLASSSGARLAKTGDGRTAIRLGEDYKSGEEMEREVEAHRGKVRVYDVRNAGKYHSFTVSGHLVHNCGYQGGVGAMKRMDRSGSIPDDELQSVVDSWRSANPNICKLWRTCEQAVRVAIAECRPVRIKNGIVFTYKNGNLFIQLPGGRKLCYWGARLEEADDGREHIYYMGVNQETKAWGWTETYGGKIVENIVQATARDCLAVAMQRVSALGYEIVMHVHDEMIVDVPKGDLKALDIINDCMAQPIDWAPGLPLKGDGYETEFYKKD